MKRIFLVSIALLFGSVIILQSCKKEISVDSINKQTSIETIDKRLYETDGVLGKTEEEIWRKAILELTMINKLISKDAYSELYYLLHNDYYIDSYVRLKDLLNPKKSIVYENSNIPSDFIGKFSEDFNKYFDSKIHPNLDYLLRREQFQGRSTALPNFLSNADIFYYQPYKENDNNEIFSFEESITYVPAVLDGNEGYGYVENVDGTWREEIINDDYMANNNTIIIEPGNTQQRMAPTDPDGGSGGASSSGNQYYGDCSKLEGTNHQYVRQVFVGHARLKHQYDACISFTGNGGGSEIIIARVGSREYLEYTNDGHDVTVTNFSDQFQKYFTRREIRRETWLWLGSLWDANWECSNPIHEQLFVVYEDDNTDPIDLDFSGIKWGDQTYGAVNLDYKVRTKDEIIRILKRESTEFFATNMLDQGGGSKAGENSFSDRRWAVYDGGLNFSYTMPHRWVVVNN